MLVKLNIINKSKFIYKIKSQSVKENGKTFLVITAPRPKNARQKNKLIEILSPYEKRIIYPKDFNSDDYPPPYPAFEIYCKKLLTDFLMLCQKKRPKTAVIYPNGLIKDGFYFDLSEYVGKIIIKTKNKDNSLKTALLAHSGTVIEYDVNYNHNEKNTEYLTMPKRLYK